MKNFSAKDKQIFDDMKNGVKESGLKVLDEKIIADTFGLYMTFSYPDSHNMGITVVYTAANEVIDINNIYATVSDDKLPSLYELLNLINNIAGLSHFLVEPVVKAIMLRTSFQVTEYFLNKKQLKRALKQHMGMGSLFIPVVSKLLFTDETPQAIMEEFNKTKDERLAVLQGPHKESAVRKKSLSHPFTIDGSTDRPVFPTHSHGMTEIGMPEFLMDPLALGADGNANRIVWSYDYFRKPINRDRLEAIEKGETFKLNIQDLKSDAKKEPLVYCYRRVYPEFEMVKQAYNLKDPADVDPKAWFVQIYIEGDDFALTDEYYRGGIQW